MAIVVGNQASPAFIVGGVRLAYAKRAANGVIGVSIGFNSSWLGDGSMPRHYQYGARMETTIGYPNPPCLALDYPGFWRFRFLVGAGTRSVTVWVKQAVNENPRPSMILKANAAVGLNADVETFAGSSTDWIQIGPVSFTATATGLIWVHLTNNLVVSQDTAYFGKVSVT